MDNIAPKYDFIGKVDTALFINISKCPNNPVPVLRQHRRWMSARRWSVCSANPIKSCRLLSVTCYVTRPITDIFTPTPSPLSELLNVVLITAQVFKDTRAQSLVNMSRAAEDLLVRLHPLIVSEAHRKSNQPWTNVDLIIDIG